jgi:hypothetical protein
MYYVRVGSAFDRFRSWIQVRNDLDPKDVKNQPKFEEKQSQKELKLVFYFILENIKPPLKLNPDPYPYSDSAEKVGSGSQFIPNGCGSDILERKKIGTQTT